LLVRMSYVDKQLPSKCWQNLANTQLIYMGTYLHGFTWTGYEAPVVPGLKPLAPLITREITYLVPRLSLKKGGGGTWALAHL
jgi:hypothetical protein